MILFHKAILPSKKMDKIILIKEDIRPDKLKAFLSVAIAMTIVKLLKFQD